jgi:hypothetical protein
MPPGARDRRSRTGIAGHEPIAAAAASRGFLAPFRRGFRRVSATNPSASMVCWE